MQNRSFFTAKGFEFRESGFRDRALAELAGNHVLRHSLEEAQHYAWKQELELLEPVALAYPSSTIAFEYMIPRMGKRVDAVVLIESAIFIIEFKIGESSYPADAINQLEDYIFDLKNFHKESHDKVLVPILVCSGTNKQKEAESNNMTLSAIETASFDKGQLLPLKSNGLDLFDLISDTLSDASDMNTAFDHASWLNSPYSPTPTIVEAAQALYQSHSVDEISRSEAGLTNINKTTRRVNEIVLRSKECRRKSICFITGVPGAGKTLVGLNLASQRREEGTTENEDLAVFLSGNGPLIEVLQASLVEDQQRRNKEKCELCKMAGLKTNCQNCEFKQTKKAIEAEVKSFVQGVHLFREEFFESERPPAEHVAIFDEAQRAWDENWLSFKMRTRRQNKRFIEMSEPQVLIDYMDRHRDWAAIVCLVGGGQEINSGEAGISEWFRALEKYHPDWDVYVSSAIESDNYLGKAKLSDLALNPVVIEELHLSVDMRSFRNINVASFAEALVTNKPEDARKLYELIIGDYPIYVTRDLGVAKEWARKKTKRPSDRCGVITDSNGQRVRADGIIQPPDFNAVKWFLRGRNEIDSSYFMEIAASEFEIQGLEIDYAIVAWEGDYRYHNGRFEHHRFKGGKWQNVHSASLQKYLTNGYRVLLTRSRQGYVIYVPKGSEIDQTRKPEFYDETYEYLLSAGIQELP